MKKIISGVFTVAVLAAFLFLLFVALSRAQTSDIIASGGTFALEKASVAGGGGEKQMLTVGENGTAGQSVAGVRSTGGSFAVYGGFWTPDDLAPTAANVAIGGRVTSSSGVGIKGVTVTIRSQTGQLRSTVSSTFGYYSFADVTVGETYIISVHSKRYAFSEPSIVRQVNDELTDIDFIALPVE